MRVRVRLRVLYSSNGWYTYCPDSMTRRLSDRLPREMAPHVSEHVSTNCETASVTCKLLAQTSGTAYSKCTATRHGMARLYTRAARTPTSALCPPPSRPAPELTSYVHASRCTCVLGFRGAVSVCGKTILRIRIQVGQSALKTPNLWLDCSFCCWAAWPRLK